MASVRRFDYSGINEGKELQDKITNFIHNRIYEIGMKTIGQLGYLFSNTILFDVDHTDIALYFDAELATEAPVKSAFNGAQKIVPLLEFDRLFSNYLYVGEAESVVTYETIEVPKYKIITDSMGKRSVEIRDKDENKTMKSRVMVMHCNLMLTMAAIHDISLNDTNFSVQVINEAKKKIATMNNIIVSGHMSRPVNIIVYASDADEYGEYMSYEPDDAFDYLMNLAKRNIKAKDMAKELSSKVGDKAKKKKKKEEKNKYAGFNKYR